MITHALLAFISHQLSYLTAQQLLFSHAPNQGCTDISHAASALSLHPCKTYLRAFIPSYPERSFTNTNEWICLSKDVRRFATLSPGVQTVWVAERSKPSLLLHLEIFWQTTFCFIFVQLLAQWGAISPFVFTLWLPASKKPPKSLCF